VKMEVVHSSDIAACLPYYKELHLGETVATIGSTRISPLTCSSSVLLFYFFYFHPIDNNKMIMDLSRNSWAVPCSNVDCP
jgi:hypothetical protein